MDQAEFDALLAKAQQQLAQPQQQQPAPVQEAPAAAPEAPQPSGAFSGPASVDPNADPQAWQDEATRRAKQAGTEPGLGQVSPVPVLPTPEAVVGGAAKAIFETKDFLFGDTAPEQRSEFRRNVEQGTAQMGKASLYDGAAAGIAQFAVGMVGVGKLAAAGKVLPWFGRVAQGLKGVKGGVAAAESAKAAAVGAVAFDPYEDRLSNLIQGTPLANPITGFLAADPNDSRAVARTKAAMESIGLDAALIGAFIGGAQTYKFLKAGDTKKAAEWAAKAEKAQQQQSIPQQAVENPDAEMLPEINVGGNTEAQPGAAQPEVPAPVGNEAGALPDGSAQAPTPPADAQGVPGVGDALDGTPSGVPAEGKPLAVDNATQAAAQQGVDLKGNPTKAFKAPTLADFDAEKVLQKLETDTQAIVDAGGVGNAIYQGHNFARGDGIPWQALSAPEEVDAFTARLADEFFNTRISKVKGSKDGTGVVHDPETLRMVNQRAVLYNEDPALLFGMLQQSGKMAGRMVADMKAGMLVADKLRTDTYNLAQRIAFGDLHEFGGNREAALLAFKRQAALLGDTLANTLAIRAAGGRIVRANRGDLLRLDASKLQSLDGDALLDLFVKTQGNPAEIARITNPTTMQAVGDYTKYVLINNLVSGPKTQLINILTNGYMMGARPLEKMIGASGQLLTSADPAVRLSANKQLREAAKMYGYYGVVLGDAWSQAKAAFLRNDSILTPHRTEMFRQNLSSNGPVQWKQMDSVGNMLWNTLMAAHVSIGMPTRGLGFVDELVKQTVYRAKLMSKASVDGLDEGMQAGLKGDALAKFQREYIEKKLQDGFDEFGHGIDPGALREAQISTFSQDLQSGLGKWFQQGAQSNGFLSYVVPFVKTPTNVLRYGWKMSPGLNLLQKEFRDSISGVHGPEIQAEAIGQFALGSLFVGVAATAVANGRITSGGPTDPKLKKELLATGWQPYSVVRTNKDGTKTYIPFGRYDPIAIPFGIVADLVDGMHAKQDPEDNTIGAAIAGLTLALSKQFREKSYLLSVSTFLDGVMDDSPDGEKAQRFFGNLATNVAVPYAAALRQLNPDTNLHEARSITDRVMSTVPGWSTTVPKQYDAWGDPITAYSRNFVSSDDKGGLVDREMQRLVLENGAAISRVSPRPQSGVDLRDITMKDGRNAYEVYQQYSGHLPGSNKPLKEIAAKVISSTAYKKAPDGDISTRGTKLYLLGQVVSRYRDSAMATLKRDPNVRDALLKKQREVIQQYRSGGKAQEGAQQEQEQSGLSSLGSAFGIDLGSLLGGGSQ